MELGLVVGKYGIRIRSKENGELGLESRKYETKIRS